MAVPKQEYPGETSLTCLLVSNGTDYGVIVDYSVTGLVDWQAGKQSSFDETWNYRFMRQYYVKLV